ncbi:thioredoxin [Lactarius quietus]|nr:thioredoxin [Lactarius quietus]
MTALETQNDHQVKSTNQFQELLSQDLQRISLLYFWAPWAAPCTQMTEVVRALAGKYPTLLLLQIEAEVDEEITESFEIESVPSFIVLRGHTLLARITGADAAASPKSSRNMSSAPASAISDSEELDQRLRRLMNQSAVVLFMKGSPDAPRCGFSRKVCGLLSDTGVEFSYFDILTDESHTYPQLIIKGEFVGGLDIVREMADSGELRELVA